MFRMACLVSVDCFFLLEKLNSLQVDDVCVEFVRKLDIDIVSSIKNKLLAFFLIKKKKKKFLKKI